MIIWVSSRLSFPLDSGGQIRTYQILRQLSRSCTVVLLSLADPAEIAVAKPKLSEICSEVIAIPAPKKKKGLDLYIDAARHLFDPVPYVIAKYYSRQLRDRLAEMISRNSVDLIVCDYLTPALCVPDTGMVPKLIFQHNVETMIWQRLAFQERNWAKRFYLGVEARKMSRFERNVLRRFDGCITVSEKDRDFFQTHFNLDRVKAIPTGVDTDYFHASCQKRDELKAFEMIFLGSMDWLPNQDAVFYFVRDILPLIRKEVPEASLTIVGRRPPESVTRIARKIPGVTVTGTVEDVRPYLHRAQLFVVPLRVGGGTRIKIFEAMASGIPVVSTIIGAEGLPVEHGRDLFLADQPEEFAAACVRVLMDAALQRQLSRSGRLLVEENFSWEKVGREFETICLNAVRKEKDES